MKKDCSNEISRRRADNRAFAEGAVRSCLRKHTVTDGYIPGQVIYNLGEYPASFSIRPTEYDDRLIRSLSERGVGLIQIHEEWNDSMRRLGADKFSSHDPEGLREFIRLCHSYNIKVIPYISSGFFDSRDPDFTERFAPRHCHELNSSYYRYRMCDPSSPEWVGYLMGKIERLLDEYEFDGLFNDMGYPVDYDRHNIGYLDYDSALDELLLRIYGLVKSRGGIVKIHEGKCLAPATTGKAYDYLWVGEGVKGLSSMPATARFEPYVVPCPDFRFMSERDENAFYSNAITFMQFVLRVDGRPITGERADVPGVEYIYNPQNDEKKHFDNVKLWYDSHPDGPHVYSEWSSIPDNPKMRERWFDYLALYRPMVTEGSRVYIDVTDSALIHGPVPQGVHLSLFVNDGVYLCISNLGSTERTVSLAGEWKCRITGEKARQITLGAGEIRFLLREEATP